MADYIDKHKAYLLLKDLEAAYIYPPVKEAYGTAARHIDQIKPENVQPVDRWINVDDRLPEEIGYYLVIIGNDMLYSIDIAEYSENRWHKHDRVIYWQELPDYPKSIKDE